MTPVVVIRPLSGYVNRLQAVASAQLLAIDIGADLWVHWTPSIIAPVPMDSVLNTDFCAAHARSSRDIDDAFGLDIGELAPYLNLDPKRGVITVAGLDLGEQTFMPKMREAWETGDFQAIVVSAGGKFTLNGGATLTPTQASEFRLRRYHVYRDLPLCGEIESIADEVLRNRDPFIALHLRYADRTLESPWRSHIGPALRDVRARTGLNQLFIATDTPKAQQDWVMRAREMNFRPWSASTLEFPRSDPRSAWEALVDWRLLSRSRAMVYFAASSFAEEAAVASGNYDVGIGLQASRMRRVWMRARQLTHALATYPRRHGWMQRHSI